MSLLMLVVVLVLIGGLIWAARRFIADALLQKIAVIVLVVAGIYIVLDALGVLTILKGLAVPHV
ncbi:MAG TPA: hypothetical protein VGU71_22300 [Candidatus Dormibacteraeota bacterium]|nr:hypothetical protein [Candidatus Dormibacteraeota bacterium]